MGSRTNGRGRPLPALAYRLGWLGLGLALLVACSAASTAVTTPAPVSLRVGYDASVKPLVDLVMPIFGVQEPGVNLVSAGGHSQSLLDDLAEGRLDAILLPSESAPDGDWWVSPLALDGLALLANPDNQVTGLTLSQARAVYQGQLWSWQMVGGAPADIEVLTVEPGSALWQVFQRLVMAEGRVTLTAVVMADAAAVIEYVAQHPWAIGYAPAALVDSRVRVLAVEGHYPTPEVLLGGAYPLAFPIYFLAAPEPQGLLRQFSAWLVSRDGQAVIGRKYGRLR